MMDIGIAALEDKASKKKANELRRKERALNSPKIEGLEITLDF